VVAVLESQDEEKPAYEQTSDLLRRHPDLRGLYVSTANSLPAIQAVSDLGKQESVVIITTDLFPELVPFIRSGRVLATMHQRPVTQGRIAFEAIHQFLLEGKCPPAHIKLAPQIVIRSNVDLILARTSSELEEPGETGFVESNPLAWRK
jgi:LacI family transcriptional regulator